MPEAVTWIRGAAAAVDPAAQQVTTESGQLLAHGRLSERGLRRALATPAEVA